MNAFKQQCIALRKKDFTLNEIVQATGRSKTSVYFHIRDISLSDKKLKEISENSRKFALKLAASRKGKALRPYKQFTRWSPDLVLLVSHLIFDGEIKKNSCGYSNRSVALIKRVQRLFQLVYDHKPKHRLDRRTGVSQIKYHNVALAGHMEQKAKELLKEIVHSPLSHQREFLRAFFDDEGCMDFKPDRNHRRIRGYQNDRHILELVQKVLIKFGIESKLRGKNEVVIIGKENLLMFQKEINFSEGVRINGKRSNSIWKKSFEKRALLDKAIKSYKL